MLTPSNSEVSAEANLASEDLPQKINTEPAEEESKAKDITARIGCLPCQHTSNRGVHDRAATLWASWSVESGGKKVFFGG